MWLHSQTMNLFWLIVELLYDLRPFCDVMFYFMSCSYSQVNFAGQRKCSFTQMQPRPLAKFQWMWIKWRLILCPSQVTKFMARKVCECVAVCFFFFFMKWCVVYCLRYSLFWQTVLFLLMSAGSLIFISM